jgi:hypothetical protein
MLINQEPSLLIKTEPSILLKLETSLTFHCTLFQKYFNQSSRIKLIQWKSQQKKKLLTQLLISMVSTTFLKNLLFNPLLKMAWLTFQLIELQQEKHSKVQIFQLALLLQSPKTDRLTFQQVTFQKYCFHYTKRLFLLLKLEIIILCLSITKMFIL